VGSAGYAYFTPFSDAGGDQRLDTGADVVLLAPTPAILLDRLLVGQAEAGAAAVIWRQHVEALRDIELDLGVNPIFGQPSRAAVDMHDRAFGLACEVQPALDL